MLAIESGKCITEPVFQHVHIGTGALGLGLAVWLGSKAGFSVILANRAENSPSLARNLHLRDSCQYELVFPNPRVESEAVTFYELIFPGQDRGKIFSSVANPQTLLLTTALKRGLHSSLQLLALAVAAPVRVAAPIPPFFIA